MDAEDIASICRSAQEAPASFITNTTDPVGVRMELSEIGPESMLGKAIAGWQ